MTRKYIDCREHSKSEPKCTLAMSADSTEEVVEAAVQHGIAAHGFRDTADLRKQLKGMVKEGTPPS